MLSHQSPPAAPAPPPPPPEEEWWQRAAARRAAWLADRPLVARGLRTATWAAAVVALVALALSPSLRLGVRSLLPCWLLLVAWFLVARTKTLRWAGVARTFALGVPLAGLVALASAALSAVLGLEVDDPGPAVGVAGGLEELLKLTPLAVLCLAAPGRVRRFAVVDWLLVGLASGLAFQAFEDGLRRVAMAERSWLDLSALLGAGDPWSDPGSGVPQYGWSLLAGWSDKGDAFFAGHHVLTALVAVGIGLAVRPGGGGRRGVARWALPVGLWVVVATAHAASNAAGWEPVAFPSGGSAFPEPLRLLWLATGRGRLLGPLLLALAVVALALDARRLRAREAAVGPHPGGWWPGWSDRWARRVLGVLALPPDAHPAFRRSADALEGLVAGAAWFAGAAGRDLATTVAVVGGAGSPHRRPGRWPAVVGLLRERREAAFALDDLGPRAGFRRAAAVASALALVLGAGLAAWLAVRIGTDLTTGGAWLAGLLDHLGDWWDSLGLGGQLVATAGLAALVVLSGGSFGLALGVAGGATWVADHGHGLADLTRDPVGTTRRFVAELTPQQAAAHALELGLQRLVPAAVGARTGRAARRAVDDLLDDPVAFRRRAADQLRDDRGSFRLGPDPWADPARREAWRRRWFDADHPTRPSRPPSLDHRPGGRPEPVRARDDPATVRGHTRQNESADVLAQHGFDVEHGPTVAGPKRPDFRIEGKIFDCYAPSTDRPRNIWANLLRDKVEPGQASRIVLDLDDSAVDLAALERQFRDWPMPGLDEVLVVRGGEVIPFIP